MKLRSLLTVLGVPALGIAALAALMFTRPMSAAAPHAADCSKAPFPAGTVHGRLAGMPFIPGTVTLQKTGSMEEDGTHLDVWTLRFEQPEGDISFGRSADIQFLLTVGKAPAGQVFRRVPGGIDAQPAMAKGLAEVQGWEFSDFNRDIDVDSNSGDGGSLRIVFARAAGSGLPGKIYLCASNSRKTWLGGSFTVDTPR